MRKSVQCLGGFCHALSLTHISQYHSAGSNPAFLNGMEGANFSRAIYKKKKVTLMDVEIEYLWDFDFPFCVPAPQHYYASR